MKRVLTLSSLIFAVLLLSTFGLKQSELAVAQSSPLFAAQSDNTSRDADFSSALGNTSAPSQLGTWECWDDGSPDPCYNGLQGLFALSSDDVWAVGWSSTILHWDGST